MRLAFSNLAWAAEDDATVLPELRTSGFDALEVAPTRLWPDPLDRSAEDVAAVRAAVEGAGLQIVALQSLLFQRPDLQLFGDAEARRGLFDHLLGMAELAARLGATRLVFGSPGNRRRGELSVEQADEIAVDLFARLGAAAADRGVCFCIEANPVDYKCDYLTDAVASTACAVVFYNAIYPALKRSHLLADSGEKRS